MDNWLSLVGHNMAVTSEIKCGTARRKSAQTVSFCIKEERNATYKKVSAILQKSELDRTDEEREMLFNCSELVKEVTRRIEKRKKVKERLQEIEDPPDLLAEKCQKLAEVVAKATNLVVYTGAGVSTAACIPDYRGTNGIWTLLQQGKDIGLHDLTQAEPTVTHMALWQLYKAGILKHVVSQNCDGLHLRSGLPKKVLSEVHGNMYVEVCCQCKPPREYWRMFDVTEHTARFSHRTMRRCYSCMGPLVDTIVHFGERGKLQWPLNWSTASKAADKADVILCIGSSLKVLKKYPWLWGMDKPVKKRPKLYIVNLQWTPKDDQAILKISGKCDEVMRQVMAHMKLDIPIYVRGKDPIFSHATALNPAEIHTASQPLLTQPLITYMKSKDKTSTTSCQRAEENSSDNVSPKIEMDIIDIPVIKSEAEHSFQFVNTNDNNSVDTDNDSVDRNAEDPFGMLETQGERNDSLIDKGMTLLVGDIWIQNEPKTVDSKSLDQNISASDGLKINLSTSLDEILNSDLGFCDQNSFQIEDVIVECDSSITSENLSHFIDSSSHTSNSISTLGCENGISSVRSSIYIIDDLHIEHSYSKTHSVPGQVVQEASPEESKGQVRKHSVDSDNSEKVSKSQKRIRTNRTENPLESPPHSTKHLGKQKVEDRKQFCDEKYDSGNTIKCSFCHENYNSNACLFYQKWTSGFDIPVGSRVCECCDTDDEDDDTDADTGTCKSDGESRGNDDANKTPKLPVVNPGWYGKGYRKRTRRR